MYNYVLIFNYSIYQEYIYINLELFCMLLQPSTKCFENEALQQSKINKQWMREFSTRRVPQLVCIIVMLKLPIFWRQK